MSNPLEQDELGDTRSEALRIARDHSGDPSLALSSMRPFRVSSMSELIMARKAVLQSTGLKLGEFAENAWGFPFIPYPAVGKESIDIYRQVPPGIEFGYVGHPIFWVDPKLTRPTIEEQGDPVRWSVRMFYLLLALGMMDGKTLRWFNGPASKNISYNEADFRNYMADYPSSLDSVKITEDDLIFPMSEVNASTAAALESITTLQDDERIRFTQLQRASLREAQGLINDDPTWNAILKSAIQLSYATSALSAQNGRISDYVDPLYQLKDQVIEYLGRIESLTLILVVPVLRDAAYTTSMYSKVVSLSANFESNVVDGQYRISVEEVLTHLFEKGGFREDTADHTILGQVIQQHHAAAVQRLTLAVHNFGRAENGMATYGSASEKDVFDQVQNLDLDFNSSY